MNLPNQQRYQELLTAGGGLARVPQDLNDYNFGSKDPDNQWCPFEWDVSALPRKFDLLLFNSSLHDQLSIGSCVANGSAKALETQFRQHAIQCEISRQFIYYNARARTAEILGVPVTDSGSSIFLSCAELTKKGAALEEVWPYDISLVNTRPSEAAYADGLTRTVDRYERIGTNTRNPRTGLITARDFVRDVKVALNCGMPVIFGTGLTQDFYAVRGPMATHPGQYSPSFFIGPTTPGFVGYHLMTVLGYDDDLNGGGFFIENSWGSEWGDNGMLFLKYSSLTATAFDSFVFRSVDGFEFPIPDSLYLWDAKKLTRQVSFDFDGIPGQCYRLYQASFNRRPDWDGLGYWIYQMQQGLGIEAVAQSFAASPEYIALFGNTDNRAYVRWLYLLALYREPDQGGWDYWTNLLDLGLMTRGQVMIGFAESAENKANCLYYYGEDGIMWYAYQP